MTWFRVDDGFHSHEKVIRIPRAMRERAIGTWTLCGTWSAEKRRDGAVPFHMVEELGGSIEAADALVAVKLWRKKRDGYQFINWQEYQFTREQLDERRRSESQRKAEWRARKARESAGVSEDVPPGQKRDDNYPSRPVIDEVPSVEGHPHVSSRERTDDGVIHMLSPVVESVIEAVAEHCDRRLHALTVHDLTAWLDERRGPRAAPLKNAARYYAKAIAGSPFEVQQFIDERGLAS